MSLASLSLLSVAKADEVIPLQVYVVAGLVVFVSVLESICLSYFVNPSYHPIALVSRSQNSRNDCYVVWTCLHGVGVWRRDKLTTVSL